MFLFCHEDCIEKNPKFPSSLCDIQEGSAHPRLLGTEMQIMEVTGTREEEVRHQARLRNEHARLLCKQKLTLVSSN